MIPYLQTEFLNSGVDTPFIVDAGGAIPFDNMISESPYFNYNANTRQFTILSEGTFLINWFVAQQTGLCSGGSNFGIQFERPILNDEPGYPGFKPSKLILGSGHVKIAPTSGFAIIDVSVEEVAAGGIRFELHNASSHDAALSERTFSKAGLSVFGGSTEKMAYGQWQASGWDKNLEPYNLVDLEAIKFNETIITPFRIVASDSTGGVGRIGNDTFTLVREGVYQISWEIPVEATYSIDGIEIALELNGVLVYSRSYAPLPIGLISGTAIISTTDINQSLRLINKQPDNADIIQIGNYSNLAIHQIS